MNVKTTERKTFSVNLTDPTQEEIERQQRRIDEAIEKHKGDPRGLLDPLDQ